MGRISIPGASIGQMTQVMPRWRGASGSVRTRSSWNCATCPKLVHTFCPLTTRKSPSTAARVWRPARSEPAFGSEKPWHQITSPRRIAGRCAAFCSSVPHAIKVGPAWLSPTKSVEMSGAPARAYSSHQTSCSMSVAPRPPCARGHAMPAQPLSYMRRCQARSYAARAPSSVGRGVRGMFASSQARAAARKASSAGLKRRSTARF